MKLAIRAIPSRSRTARRTPGPPGVGLEDEARDPRDPVQVVNVPRQLRHLSPEAAPALGALSQRRRRDPILLHHRSVAVEHRERCLGGLAGAPPGLLLPPDRKSVV